MGTKNNFNLIGFLSKCVHVGAITLLLNFTAHVICITYLNEVDIVLFCLC